MSKITEVNFKLKRRHLETPFPWQAVVSEKLGVDVDVSNDAITLIRKKRRHIIPFDTTTNVRRIVLPIPLAFMPVVSLRGQFDAPSFVGKFYAHNNYDREPIHEDLFYTKIFKFPLQHEGLSYYTIASYVHAMRTLDKTKRREISRTSFGEQVKINQRADWANVRFAVMKKAYSHLFSDHRNRGALLATYPYPLFYTEDPFWGIDRNTGDGYNVIGRMLMYHRHELLWKAKPTKHKYETKHHYVNHSTY